MPESPHLAPVDVEESSAILQRELITTSCVHNLSFSVTIQGS